MRLPNYFYEYIGRNVEGETARSYTPTLPYVFVARCLIYPTEKSNFTTRCAGLQSGIPLQTEHTYTHHMLCCRITTLKFYIFNKF